MTATDQAFMARSLALARRGLNTTDPNPRVGCVVVRDDRIVGEGWHQHTGGPHAEIIALRQAGSEAAGATVYVNLEPCCHQGRTPPCADALVGAGVARVVIGTEDPNPMVKGGGMARLTEAGIDVVTGPLAELSRDLNRGFEYRHRRGRPWVRLKLAASLDGRTALANGLSQWLTGPAAREDVQRLRARSSAIMTGIGTVLADDPALTVRRQGQTRQPLKVVLDSGGRTPPAARIARQPGSLLIFCLADPDPALADAGAEVEQVAADSGRVNLKAVLANLAQREINEVQVESGPTLAGALLDAQLVDELVLYLAPTVLGDDARGMFSLPQLSNLDGQRRLEVRDLRNVGDDIRITMVPR